MARAGGPGVGAAGKAYPPYSRSLASTRLSPRGVIGGELVRCADEVAYSFKFITFIFKVVPTTQFKLEDSAVHSTSVSYSWLFSLHLAVIEGCRRTNLYICCKKT